MPRCCRCPTFECCDGNLPSGFEVAIELTDADCDLCDEVWSGTFSLTYLGGCVWLYDSGLASIDPPVTPIIGCRVAESPQARFVYRRQVSLSIVRTGANYQIDLFYQVGILECDGAGTIPDDCVEQVYQWNWRETVAVAEFDCSDVTSFPIPRLDRETYGDLGTPVWPCNATDSTRADALLSSLA